jgi:hypothetical protein
MKRAARTSFHDWEDDACRIHHDERGNVTADLYRPGRGHIPVSPGDVVWCGMQISEAAYNQLVAFHDELEGVKAKD